MRIQPKIWALLAGGLAWLASVCVGADAPMPYLGVSVTAVSPALRAQLDLPTPTGVLLAQVMDESPAQAAGLQRFDVLVAVDGVTVASERDLADVVAANAVGAEIRCKIIRKAEPLERTVRLAARPSRVVIRGSRPTETPGAAGALMAVFHDGAHLVRITRRPGGNLRVWVRDRDGNTLYNDEVITHEQLQRLPDAVRQHLLDSGLFQKP